MDIILVLRILLLATGILLLIWDFLSYARQKLTENMGLLWGVFSVLLIVSGAAPAVTKLFGGQVEILFFILGIMLIVLLFRLSMLVSVLAMKNQELAMQVSLLNQENERILHEIGILTDEKKDTVRN